MHEDEHENVVRIIATYLLDNFFSENWFIVLGRKKKEAEEMRKEKRKGRAGQTDVPCVSHLLQKKVTLVFVAAEFFKLAWSVCEELSFRANTVTFGD